MPRYTAEHKQALVEQARQANSRTQLHSIADQSGVPVATLRGWIAKDALVRGETPSIAKPAHTTRDPDQYTVEATRRNNRRSWPSEIREEALRRCNEGERAVDISRDLTERGHAVSWRTIYSWREKDRRKA